MSIYGRALWDMLATLDVVQQRYLPNADSRDKRSDKRKDNDGGKISKEIFLDLGLIPLLGEDILTLPASTRTQSSR